MHRPGYGRQIMPRTAYGSAERWNRTAGYNRHYGRGLDGAYGDRRALRDRPRPYREGPRGYAYPRGDRYGYRSPGYYYGYSYRPRVRYAYAETPYAYDLPRETYATGIFPTNAALGLHTYDYAYTTRVRPIAAYGGATGSYAGGYPIYNRPLAPAYPTPGCDCDY